VVYVLTDGTARDCPSRLEWTRQYVADAGCEPGSVFGRVSDQELYARVLRRDTDFFLSLAEELALDLTARCCDTLVVDAAGEGIMAHDIWQSVVHAASQAMCPASAEEVTVFDFLLDGRPDQCPPEDRDDAIWIHLWPSELNRKMMAAWSNVAIRKEVEKAIATIGEEGLSVECLRPHHPAPLGLGLYPCEAGYEAHGKKLVAQGIYPEVLRYRDHVLPIMWALQEWAEQQAHLKFQGARVA
jgi:hypothetical protein